MINKTKLAVFDVDGTIGYRGKIPATVVEGFKNLHSKGYITTISTGRSYVSLKNVLGDLFDTLISPEALIIIEHGSKIVDKQGNIVFGEFFGKDEIDHMVEFSRANIELFQSSWYSPIDLAKKIQMWCIDERYFESTSNERSYYADVFKGSMGEYRNRLLNERLSCVSFRLRDTISVENFKLNFTKTNTKILFQDGIMEFLKANSNKGLAVEYVVKHLGIEKSELLVAGNAINDVEMLDVGPGISILVSDEENRKTILSYMSDPNNVINVSTSEELGNYLNSVS